MAPAFSKTEIGILLSSGLIPLVAYSQVFMSEEQAVKAIFPGVMTKKVFSLTSDEVHRIEKKSGERVRASSVIAWVSPKKEILFLDEVLGKHEFIAYAVGVSESKVK